MICFLISKKNIIYKCIVYEKNSQRLYQTVTRLYLFLFVLHVSNYVQCIAFLPHQEVYKIERTILYNPINIKMKVIYFLKY